MRSNSTHIHFGTSYCPFAKSGDVAMEFWDRDFATMKGLGFNAVRCFVAWDRIEMEEGKRDFSKIDRVFELADHHGIDVILNVGGVFACYGGIYPPRWLIRDYKCQGVVEDPRRADKPFGPNRALCLDDAIYQAKAEAFTIAVIRRYAAQQRLFGWNVWNEAHQAPICHCPTTIDRFRSWLRQRYHDDLDALNRLWGTEFPVLYRSWDEVEPGLGAGFLVGGLTARLDWLRFNRARVASWITGVHDLVHAHDPQCRPTTSNIVTTTVVGDFWGEHGHPDLWSQAERLDISGFSFYTMYGPPAHLSAGLAAVRGSSNDAAHSFWVLETEGGQVGEAALYPNAVADGPRRAATHWLSVLHGARTILLWKFGGRVTDNQTERFNLTAWDGSVTDRARLNAEVCRTLATHERIFLERSYRAEVGILFAADTAMFAHVTKREKDWSAAWRGAWKILRDLQVQADIVSDAQARIPGSIDRFRVLILPCLISLDAALAAQIADFVRRGGTVIADQCLAIFDTNGHNQLRAPGFGLETIFGAYLNDFVLGPPEMPIAMSDGGSLAVDGNLRSSLIPSSSTCSILARWPDGSVAMTSQSTATGKCVWFGFQAFREHDRRPTPGILALIRKVLAEAGVASAYTVEGLRAEHDVEFGAITTAEGGSALHFIINLGAVEERFTLGLRSTGDGTWRDLLTGRSWDFSRGPVDIVLPAWSTIILGDQATTAHEELTCAE